ncbi:MAG: acyltransferase [Victivallales bacterium]|jgi:acetyltransferase-like isoleucine patch superfamily enzyme
MIRTLLDKLMSRIKNSDFELDKRIPASYLFGFFLAKSIALARGTLLFHRRIRAFVSPGTKLKCKKMIRFGNNLCIDRGCYIDALSEEGITFGRNVSIGKSTHIECTGSLRNLGKGLHVGDNVGLGSCGFFGCAGGISIGDDTLFGNYVSLHAENHNYKDSRLPIRQQGVNRKGIKVGSNCWIGAKATILDGADIGNGSIVAAGAVVLCGTYPPDTILAGVPAKPVKEIRKFSYSE